MVERGWFAFILALSLQTGFDERSAYFDQALVPRPNEAVDIPAALQTKKPKDVADAAAAFERGMVFVGQEAWTEAEKELHSAEKKTDNQSQTYVFAAAYAYLKLHRADDAFKRYEKIYKKDPASRRAMLGMAAAYEDMPHYADAVRIWLRYTKTPMPANEKAAADRMLAGARDLFAEYYEIAENPAGGAKNLATPEQELAWGLGYAQQLTATGVPLIGDDMVTGYVQALCQQLVSHAKQFPTNYEVFVLDSATVNALTTPGYIFVYRGILNAVKTEDELAGVLSHEIGHSVAHHVAKAQTKQSLDQQQAEKLKQSNSRFSQFLGKMLESGNPLGQLSFSRENEAQADRLGVHIAYDAGFNPDGLVGMFRTFESMSPSSRSSWDLMSRTHPYSIDRVKERCQVYVDPMSLCPDPAYGKWKSVVVVHTCNGKTETTSFPDTAQLELKCAITETTAPESIFTVPKSIPPPGGRAAQGITVVAGTYGGNCGTGRGNVTDHLTQACGGKMECAYVVDTAAIGDPRFGCAKDYVAEWRCGNDAVVHRAEASPEAGNRKTVALSCVGYFPEEAAPKTPSTVPPRPPQRNEPAATQSPASFEDPFRRPDSDSLGPRWREYTLRRNTVRAEESPWRINNNSLSFEALGTGEYVEDLVETVDTFPMDNVRVEFEFRGEAGTAKGYVGPTVWWNADARNLSGAGNVGTGPPLIGVQATYRWENGGTRGVTINVGGVMKDHPDAMFAGLNEPKFAKHVLTIANGRVTYESAGFPAVTYPLASPPRPGERRHLALGARVYDAEDVQVLQFRNLKITALGSDTVIAGRSDTTSGSELAPWASEESAIRGRVQLLAAALKKQDVAALLQLMAPDHRNSCRARLGREPQALFAKGPSVAAAVLFYLSVEPEIANAGAERTARLMSDAQGRAEFVDMIKQGGVWYFRGF